MIKDIWPIDRNNYPAQTNCKNHLIETSLTSQWILKSYLKSNRFHKLINFLIICIDNISRQIKLQKILISIKIKIKLWFKIITMWNQKHSMTNHTERLSIRSILEQIFKRLIKVWKVRLLEVRVLLRSRLRQHLVS